MFAVDMSGSIAEQGYKSELQFISNLVDYFDIGPTQTQVSMISYDSNNRLDFDFKTHSTAASLKSAISSASYTGGGTKTSKAIDLARTQFSSTSSGVRPDSEGVSKVLVVLTDGSSDDEAGAIAAAEKVKALNVNIFTIGLGSSLNRNELLGMATEPQEEHFIELSQVKDIEAFSSTMAMYSCNEPAKINPGESFRTDISDGEMRYVEPSCQVLTDHFIVDAYDLKGFASLFVSTQSKNPGPFDYEKKSEVPGRKRIYMETPGNDPIYIGLWSLRCGANRDEITDSEVSFDFLNDIFNGFIIDFAEVREHQSEGLEVYRPKAPSFSKGVSIPNIVYSLENADDTIGANSTLPFAINPSDGTVTTSEELEFDENQKWRIRILAHADGTAELSRCIRGGMEVIVSVIPDSTSPATTATSTATSTATTTTITSATTTSVTATTTTITTTTVSTTTEVRGKAQADAGIMAGPTTIKLTTAAANATWLQVNDECDPIADVCDTAEYLVCSMDANKCVYAATTAMAAATTTTAPAEASSGKQKSAVRVVGAAAGLVLFLVVFIGCRRCRNDAPIKARISLFTANPSYPDLKAAPQTQPALITDGAYIDVETSTQAEESKYDNAFGNDGFSAAIAGFQEILAPALPLEPYGTFVGGSDRDDEGAEREGIRSVDDSAPRVLNGTDAYLLSSSQQVVLYDAGDVPGIASNQLPVYSEIAEELFAAEPINAATQRCKYRQPGPGGQRCKCKTATEWCEKHTCGILACRNSASASQSMYEEPSQQQVQVYDDGGAPGAADHFAGGAYASVGNDQKAYGSITATHPGSGMYDEIDGTYEGGEETYDGIDDDDISL